jgi:hypothetical protein
MKPNTIKEEGMRQAADHVAQAGIVWRGRWAGISQRRLPALSPPSPSLSPHHPFLSLDREGREREGGGGRECGGVGVGVHAAARGRMILLPSPSRHISPLPIECQEPRVCYLRVPSACQSLGRRQHKCAHLDMCPPGHRTVSGEAPCQNDSRGISRGSAPLLPGPPWSSLLDAGSCTL